MQQSIISQLRSASPQGRAEIINERYDKNRHFFRQYFPEIDTFLEDTHCPYSINMTDSFLSIKDEKSGETAHPLPLDNYAEVLGGWQHEAWTELFCLKVSTNSTYPVHEGIVIGLSDQLVSHFPQYNANYHSGRINLKPIDKGKRRFSPPVIFLGIFHGLHIDYHYQCTDMPTALFVEPEPERFEVSLYFLDYEEIWQKENALYLSIGLQLNSEVFDSFFSPSRTTPHLWCRLLSSYVTPSLPYFVEQFRTLQLAKHSIFYPIDRTIENLHNGLLNLNSQLPILSKIVTDRQPYHIVVVASGPSLDETLPLIKKNRENLIVFAVHTAVLALKEYGIQPDFQFCLDTVYDEGVKQIGLLPDVPLILSYQAASQYKTISNEPLFVLPEGIPHSACLRVPFLDNVAPSTTNLAFAMACHCQPQAIYMVGCDFGFRDPQRHHARGTIYFDSKGNKKNNFDEKFDNIILPANFPSPAAIYSTPFFVQTKQSVEKAIQENKHKTPVFNLSDGALVVGAKPKNGIEMNPKGKAVDRKKGVQLIKNLFESAIETQHWDHFSGDAEVLLAELKKDFMKTLQVTPFSWLKVSQQVDTVLAKIFEQGANIPRDGQFKMYQSLFADLLSHLYICLLFTDTEGEGKQVYKESLRILEEIITQISWYSNPI